MRGEQYDEYDDGSVVLLDPVFVIDGFQRVSAARLSHSRGEEPFLGAKLHFGTSFVSEEDMFRTLNLTQHRVSPNIILRNERRRYPVVDALIKLTTDDPDFPLANRLSWKQRSDRSHLMTAFAFAKAIGSLHAHIGAGNYTGVMPLIAAMQSVYDKIGHETYVANVRTFVGLCEESWGISKHPYRGGITSVKAVFQRSLARVLDEHTVFWNDHQLVISKALRSKFRLLKVNETAFGNVCNAGGAGGSYIVQYIVHHINKGRRSGHLKTWSVTQGL